VLPPVGQARGALLVPPGNHYKTQPDIPFASARRTKSAGATYEKKLQRTLSMLARGSSLSRKIRQVAKLYDIDPVHIVGAIVGEHTYNYSPVDTVQSYYIKVAAYSGLTITFAHNGEHVLDFVKRPQFARCNRLKSSVRVWACREDVWYDTFRGRKVGGVSFPNKRFSDAFFLPLFAGQSFGLGQLTPLTILKMSERVHKTSGYPLLSARDGRAVYAASMDPDTSLHYIAAVLRDAIDTYRHVAHFDISKNPGITATLYNLGNVYQRARKLRSINMRRRARGRKPVFPKENYYGWLVNDRIDELRALVR